SSLAGPELFRGLPAREHLRPHLRMAGHHLRRVSGLRAELLRGMPGPARIVHCAATDADEVGLAGGNDVLRRTRISDQADRHGLDASFLAHLLAERHLIIGSQWNLLAR